MFSGCRHAAIISAVDLVVEDKARPAVEARWDAEAERLFAEYTSGPQWSEAQRAAFRERLWPTPPPIVPAVLFQRHDHGEERPTFRHSNEPTDLADY